MSAPLKAAGLWLLDFLGLQFYQPERTNPVSDPAASLEAVANPPPELPGIARRACYDCPSNQTHWPWHSRISPVSWLVARDVRLGRGPLNFSERHRYSPQAAQLRMTEACQEVRAGTMPLKAYRVAHSEARLTSQDVDLICAAAQSAERNAGGNN